VSSLLASLPSGQWRDDSFLTPVLADDPLLFGLDDEDEEMELEPQAAASFSAEELRAENESLKLQARPRWHRNFNTVPNISSAAVGADGTARGGCRTRARRAGRAARPAR
jgi:hypothetical protein